MEGKIVAVTGASGFIGSHICKQLVEQGCVVRACVRDAESEVKTQHLREIAESSAGSISFFSCDLLKEGSFDAAFDGSDAVVHTAAVVLVTASDPQRDIIDPSVVGTRNVLGAVDRAKSVRRFVHTSSVAAVHTHAGDAAHVYDESDWNSADAGTDPYGFAKREAERMVQQAADASAGRWDVAIMNPGMVWGPCLTKAHTKASPVFVRQHLYGNTQPSISFPIVDVRDVAAGHVAALALPRSESESEKIGRHVLVSGTEMFTEELGGKMQKMYPQLVVETKALSSFWVWFGALNPCVTAINVHMALHVIGKPFHYSNAKATRVLGIKWRDANDTLRDTVDSMIDTGFVKPRRLKGGGSDSKKD